MTCWACECWQGLATGLLALSAQVYPHTHSSHLPPWPGHSCPDCLLLTACCLLLVYQYTHTHSPHPPILISGLATRLYPTRPHTLLIVSNCTRTHPEMPHHSPCPDCSFLSQLTLNPSS
jgi:hypothetical protein